MTKTTNNEHGAIRAVEFELAFVGGFESLATASGVIVAKLTSPLLDSELHPACTLPVHVETRLAKPGTAPSFILDGLHLGSITEYLHNQAHVRRTLEEELDRERSSLSEGNRWRRSDLWACVKVLHMIVSLRKVPSAEQLSKMKDLLYPDKSLDEIASMYDSHDTRSRFVLVLSVNWDSDHQRWAEYRDGILVSVTME